MFSISLFRLFNEMYLKKFQIPNGGDGEVLPVKIREL